MIPTAKRIGKAYRAEKREGTSLSEYLFSARHVPTIWVNEYATDDMMRRIGKGRDTYGQTTAKKKEAYTRDSQFV